MRSKWLVACDQLPFAPFTEELAKAHRDELLFVSPPLVAVLGLFPPMELGIIVLDHERFGGAPRPPPFVPPSFLIVTVLMVAHRFQGPPLELSSPVENRGRRSHISGDVSKPAMVRCQGSGYQ